MDTERTVKEVLEITLDKVEKTIKINKGNGYPKIGVFICNEIDYLHYVYRIITEEEKSKTLLYFELNRPTKDLHKEFFNHPTFNNKYSWWKELEESNVQRIKFLKHLIKQCNI